MKNYCRHCNKIEISLKDRISFLNRFRCKKRRTFMRYFFNKKECIFPIHHNNFKNHFDFFRARGEI